MRISGPASRMLAAVLRGERAAEQPTADLRARAADGDEQARVALSAVEQAAAGARLAELALVYEAAQVRLVDGTALSLDDGERALAGKEERRPHPALRAALDRALDPVRQLFDYRTVGDDAADQATAFLAATDDLGHAALEALEVLAGAEVVDAASLAWALDPPSTALQCPQALALVDAGRAAAGATLRTMRVPRVLAGVVLLGEEPRLGVFPGLLRAHRFFQTVRGGYQAVAVAALVPALGSGMALGALLPPVLRGAGLSRSDADRSARVGVARAVVAARVAAARARLDWPEALERAVARSVRPTLALRELLDEQLAISVGPDVTETVGAAAVAVALREAHDEAFAISAAGWREPMAALAGTPATAWRRWAEPWL